MDGSATLRLNDGLTIYLGDISGTGVSTVKNKIWKLRQVYTQETKLDNLMGDN
jgi:hypothetical protein